MNLANKATATIINPMNVPPLHLERATIAFNARHTSSSMILLGAQR